MEELFKVLEMMLKVINFSGCWRPMAFAGRSQEKYEEGVH